LRRGGLRRDVDGHGDDSLADEALEERVLLGGGGHLLHHLGHAP